MEYVEIQEYVRELIKELCKLMNPRHVLTVLFLDENWKMAMECRRKGIPAKEAAEMVLEKALEIKTEVISD